MEKKLAMISQPMNGKTDEEILEAKNNAKEFLEKAGYEVMNTFFQEEWADPDKMKENGVIHIPVAFLSKSLEAMSKCSVVYFCKGWRNARGCRMEHITAQEYNIPILYEEFPTGSSGDVYIPQTVTPEQAQQAVKGVE